MYFWIFWIATAVGAVALQPYQYSILKAISDKQGKELPSKIKVMLSVLTQTIVIMGISSYLGVKIAPKVGLDWHIIRHWIEGTRIPFPIGQMIIVSVALGAIGAAAIALLDIWFMKRIESNVKIDDPTPGRMLMASLYGGISEEIGTRLFFMSLFVYLSKLIGITGSGGYWIGIFLAAIVFGLGHLSGAVQLFGAKPIVVARTIILNGIVGVAFGWLFWKYSIEAAMIAHFVTDNVAYSVMRPIINKGLEAKKIKVL